MFRDQAQLPTIKYVSSKYHTRFSLADNGRAAATFQRSPSNRESHTNNRSSDLSQKEYAHTLPIRPNGMSQ